MCVWHCSLERVRVRPADLTGVWYGDLPAQVEEWWGGMAGEGQEEDPVVGSEEMVVQDMDEGMEGERFLIMNEVG